MTPEERARDVVKSFFVPQDKGKDYVETPMRKVLVDIVAKAIGEAEEAAFDRAARAIHAETKHLAPKAEATVEEFMKRSHNDGLVHAVNIVARLRLRKD